MWEAGRVYGWVAVVCILTHSSSVSSAKRDIIFYQSPTGNAHFGRSVYAKLAVALNGFDGLLFEGIIGDQVKQGLFTPCNKE